MSESSGHRAALTIAFSLAIAYAAAVLTDITELWGLNIARFLPWWWQWASVLIVAVALLRPFSRRIIEHLARLGGRDRDRSGTSYVVVAAVALAAVFYLFHIQSHFLGDANLRLNQLQDGRWFLPTETGDFFLHAALYNWILKPFNQDPETAYHLLSALSGVLFFAGCYRLARYLSARYWLPVLVVLCSTGLTVQFFGYVESYALLAGISPFFILAAFKLADNRGGVGTVLGLFLVAALLHTVAVFVLGGVIIAAFGKKYLLSRESGRKSLRILLAGTVLGIVGLYAGRSAGIADLGRYVIPILPTEQYQHGFFSGSHALNLLNWLFLAALPVLPAAAALIAGGREKSKPLSRRGLLAAWLVTPALVFAVFFSPQLGGPRDWDLFVPVLFVIVPAILALYIERHDDIPPAMFSTAVLSLMVVVSFVAVNVSTVRATDRFVELIEVSRFKNLTKEYRTLAEFAETRPELMGRQFEFAQKAWEEPPYTHEDSMALISQLATEHMRRGNLDQARQLIQLGFETDSLDLNTHLALMEFMQTMGNKEQLAQLAGTIESRFHDKPLGRMNAGVLFMQVGQTEDGRRNIEAAYALDSTENRIILNYATLLSQEGNYEESLRLLDKILNRGYERFLAWFYGARANLELGRFGKAMNYLEKAAAMAPNRQASEMAQRLQNEIVERQAQPDDTGDSE